MRSLILTAGILTWGICNNINFMLVKNRYQLCGWLLVFNQANYSGYRYMSSLFDNTAVIIYGWTSCLYLGKFKHWLNLHHQLNYCCTQHHLVLFMVITNKGKCSKVVCPKVLYPSCLYTQGQSFLFDEKYHIRLKINNSCWSSRYMMQYAFNMWQGINVYESVWWMDMCL